MYGGTFSSSSARSIAKKEREEVAGVVREEGDGREGGREGGRDRGGREERGGESIAVNDKQSKRKKEE